MTTIKQPPNPYMPGATAWGGWTVRDLRNFHAGVATTQCTWDSTDMQGAQKLAKASPQGFRDYGAAFAHLNPYA